MFKVLSVLVLSSVAFLTANAEQVSIFKLLSKAGETTDAPLISTINRGNLGRCDVDPNNYNYFFDAVGKMAK